MNVEPATPVSEKMKPMSTLLAVTPARSRPGRRRRRSRAPSWPDPHRSCRHHRTDSAPMLQFRPPIQPDRCPCASSVRESCNVSRRRVSSRQSSGCEAGSRRPAPLSHSSCSDQVLPWSWWWSGPPVDSSMSCRITHELAAFRLAPGEHLELAVLDAARTNCSWSGTTLP